MAAFANILLGGVFHAAVLFLVAAGLQLIFGVQKIVNLACGSFYALGAYFGITLVGIATQYGMPAFWLLPALLVAGLLAGLIGPFVERLLRPVYDRDESFQLLLTFALVLMFQDVFRFLLGREPTHPRYLLSRLWRGRLGRFQCARLQPPSDRGRGSDRDRARLFPAAHELRPHPACYRREPHHGGSARRQCTRRLCSRLHHRHHARHDRRSACHSDSGDITRHGGRIHR